MHITLLTNTLQRDSLNPPDEDDAEIVFWKRVKAKGMARPEKGKATPFLVILDVRSRLMQVRTEQPFTVGAAEIGQALVDEMASYTLEAVSRNFVEKERSARQAEWMVRDAEHASGLLHRLREGKEFEWRKGRRAPGLDAAYAALIESVNANLLAMHAWNKNRQSPAAGPMFIPFDLFTWQTLQTRLQELSDDLELQLKFARFFGYVEIFKAAPTSTYNREPDPPRNGTLPYPITPVTPAVALNRIWPEATQLGYKLLMSFEKEFQLPVYLRDH